MVPRLRQHESPAHRHKFARGVAGLADDAAVPVGKDRGLRLDRSRAVMADFKELSDCVDVSGQGLQIAHGQKRKEEGWRLQGTDDELLTRAAVGPWPIASARMTFPR